MAPPPREPGDAPPPDLSPQKPDESWSDYWARTHPDQAHSTSHRYPWGEQEWPGADKSKDKYIYRPELVNIAKALRQDLARYTGGNQSAVGSPSSKTKTSAEQLADAFGVSPAQVGTWDAASTFHGTLTKVHRSMLDAHDTFV